VARSLVAEGKLVGALGKEPRERHDWVAEEFGALCRCGKLFLPKLIRWVDRRRGTETVYQVQQIDVLYQYDKDFIDSLKKEHFE
jgi:hypothetical protein